MSDTIQSRHYSARQASLFQLRPSALIDAVDSGIHEPVLHHLPTKFHGGGQASMCIVGTGAVGSAISKAITGSVRVLVLVDTDWSTSGGEMAVELNHYGSDSWRRWAETTKAVLTQSAPDSKTAPSAAAARLRVERLTALQASFGLPMSELAQVLGITRQGLYKWLDASKDLKVQGANQERLARVERIAKQWRELSPAPLSSVAREPLANGRTVLDLLIEEIDEAAVIGAFDQLAAKLHAKPKSRSQKLADAGFKRRPSARALPADE